MSKKYYLLWFLLLSVRFLCLAQFQVSGKIVTDDDKPLDNAKVSVNGSTYAVTNRIGTFSLTTTMRFSKPSEVKVFKKGFKIKDWKFSENTRFLEIIMQSASSLRGKVLSYQNKPVANAKVLLDQGVSMTMTNDLGEFTMAIAPEVQINTDSKFSVNDIDIAFGDRVLKDNNGFVYLKMPKPPEEEKPNNQVVKIRLFDAQKKLLPNVALRVDGILYQSNGQAWVNLTAPTFRFSQFKFDDYEISEQDYLADTEVLNIYLKPNKQKANRNNQNNYAKEFTLIEDELKSQREFQVQKTSILKRELASLASKLNNANLDEKQRKLLQEYLFSLENTFYENDSVYQKLQKEAKSSLAEMKAAIVARDSINLAAQEKIKKITEQSTEDKRLADLRYRTTVWIAAIIVFSLLIIALILYIIGRRMKKQRDEIEKVKNELADKVVQIAQQKEDILLKSNALEQAYTQIQYSIMSAQRIQQSILYKPKDIIETFKEGFIIFKPKDIVSGDFYWFSNKGAEIVLVGADCTGHGVPGAFMTMLGHTLLNQIINEDNITDPAEVLKILDTKIQTLLHQQVYEKGGSTEGMDLAMITVHKYFRRVVFSGAKFPVYISRQGAIEYFAGTNATIGGSALLKRGNQTREFKNTTIELEGDEIIYLSSDGFSDQFGGAERKKYMKTRFKEFLERIQNEPLVAQEQNLLQEFDDWKGANPQVDDVMLVGIKLQ